MRLLKRIFFILLIIASIISIFFIYKKTKPHHKGIITIHSLQEALPYLKNANEKTLCFFDIDDTIIRGYDIGMANGGDLPISFIIGALFKHPSLIRKTKWEYYYSLMWQNAKRFVIDPLSIKIIKELKNKECPVLGLTLIESRSFGVIRDFTKFRYKMLKELGVEMTQKFGTVYFTKLQAYRYNYPELYKGILFSNRLSKEKVLGAFIDYFKLKPDKIIFFDDHIGNLDNVGQECDKRKIPFYGFHYLAKKKLLENKFSTKRALLELDYLMKYERWLTNEEADSILKK